MLKNVIIVFCISIFVNFFIMVPPFFSAFACDCRIKRFLSRNENNDSFQVLITWLRGKPVQYLKYLYQDHPLDNQEIINIKHRLRKMLSIMKWGIIILMIQGIAVLGLAYMYRLR